MTTKRKFKRGDMVEYNGLVLTVTGFTAKSGTEKVRCATERGELRAYFPANLKKINEDNHA